MPEAKTQAGAQFDLQRTFQCYPHHGKPLVYTPPSLLKGYQTIRIETTTSPSWVA